jgi:nicotinamide-nucleotide amidase
LQDAKNRLGKELFGVDCGPLEEVVAALLREQGKTVAVAESCTAGRLAAALTVKSGASAYFMGGALVYSNAEKVRSCGVDPAVLASDGAVSEAVARQLAEGIRRAVGSDLGVAVTGIAGPEGGSAEKPVGTVHIAVASSEKTTHRKLLLPGDRERVMRFSVGAALELLRRCLLST